MKKIIFLFLVAALGLAGSPKPIPITIVFPTTQNFIIPPLKPDGDKIGEIEIFFTVANDGKIDKIIKSNGDSYLVESVLPGLKEWKFKGRGKTSVKFIFKIDWQGESSNNNQKPDKFIYPGTVVLYFRSTVLSSVMSGKTVE